MTPHYVAEFIQMLASIRYTAQLEPLQMTSAPAVAAAVVKEH